MGFEVTPHSEVMTNLLTRHVTLDKSVYFFECRFLYPKLGKERVALPYNGDIKGAKVKSLA